MINDKTKRRIPMIKTGLVTTACVLIATASLLAAEVNKGEIPDEHLVPSLKTMPCGALIWDNEEAIEALSKGETDILWIDTRPPSFFDNGTIRDAVLAVYDKTGATYPDGEPVLTPETLKQDIIAAGKDPDQVRIAFFCQGPKCHRSYNAAFVAVTEWGYAPEKIIWYRDGYPNLLKAVREDPKLKRRAKRLLSDSALKTL